MKSIIPIENYLKVVNEFNVKYPGSHVGGSVGLFLHGIDLKRQFVDLDITMPQPLPEQFKIGNSEISSNFEDFDCQLRVYFDNGSLYIKADINVKECGYDTIEHNGIFYNVSQKADIIEWKKKYANKGVQKHIDDLIAIETGIRPAEKVLETVTQDDDDLPF